MATANKAQQAADRVTLGAGLCVIQRDDRTVQIGSDPPRCVVVHNLPPGTAEVLARLDGSLTTAEVLQQLQRCCGADPDFWSSLLAQLRAAGILYSLGRTSRVDDSSAVVRPEVVPLARNYGPDLARRFLRRRADALVTIAGVGRVATSISSILVSAGIGHVYIRPGRPLQPVDTSPAGLAADWGGNRPDRERLAAVARRVRPDVATHAPTVDVPDLVVLAHDGPPEPLAAADLLHESIPHLSVFATAVRGVVGPLVLPGRSSCLSCEQLHRTDRDPGWPTIGRAAGRILSVPSSCLSTSVAAAAAAQVLQFIDGRVPPATINGTLEWQYDDWRPRRRSWSPHPECSCRTAGPTVGALPVTPPAAATEAP